MSDASLIYLDNNATTKTDPAVVNAMMPYLTEEYGNPSSAYRFGKHAAEAVERAREQVANSDGMRASGDSLYQLRNGIK